MIVKNEEEDLPKCLNAVKTYVDEIIIVDTGSTDKTVTVAKKYTGKVFYFKWRDDFAAARNESLKHASGDWILVLDADEIVSPEDLKRIRDLIAFDDVDGYALVQRNYRQPSLLYITNAADPKDPYARGMSCYDDNKIIRLFRRKKEIYFVYQVHEAVGPSLKEIGYRVQPTNVIIHHYNKALINPQVRERKDEFYLKIGLDEIKKDPKNDKPYFEVGVYYFNHQNYEKALDYLKKAYELNPDLKLTAFYLGITYELLGRAEEAIPHYQKSLDSPHNPTMPYVNLSNIYVALGQYKDAQDLSEQGLQKNPGNFPLYNTLGYIYLVHNQLHAAVDTLHQGLLYSPNLTNLYTIKIVNNLVAAYIAQEKYMQAITLLLDHIKRNPLVADYYYNLAQVYTHKREYVKSIAILEKGIKHLPKATELQTLLEETKKQEKAKPS